MSELIKKDLPLISVVVPVYMVSAFVEKAIQSILSQTYKNIEIILIDDGTKDNSGQICDYYKSMDSRIRVVHKTNEGLSATRNLGVEIANGDYICFVDSDDTIHPYMIQCLYETLVSNNADISVSQYSSEPDYEFHQHKVEVNPSDVRVMTNIQSLNEIITENGVVMIVVWNKLYKRELFKDVVFPVGRVYEDEATTHKLLYNAQKIVVLNEVLYYYRYNIHGITSSQKQSSYKDKFKAICERADYFQLKGESELAKMFAASYLRYIICNLKIYKSEGKTTEYIFLKKLYKKEFIRLRAWIRFGIKSGIRYIGFYFCPKVCISLDA